MFAKRKDIKGLLTSMSPEEQRPVTYRKGYKCVGSSQKTVVLENIHVYEVFE